MFRGPELLPSSRKDAPKLVDPLYLLSGTRWLTIAQRGDSLKNQRIREVQRKICLSRWARGLRRRSAALACCDCGFESRWGSWMSVRFECCVLSVRGLCDGLITHPEESYRLWCVVVCYLESSWMRRLGPTGGCCAKSKQTKERRLCQGVI